MTKTANIICMRWGDRYPVHYVNKLYNGVKRNIDRPFRFICFTDDAEGLADGVEAHPLPPITLPESIRWTPWRKLAVWQYPLAELEGDVLFLDVDLVVVGPLGPLFDYEPGQFCVIENWTQLGEGIGNTSVFRFPVEKYKAIFDEFDSDMEGVLKTFRIEQQYISARIPERIFWPAEWCISYKHSVLPKFPLNWFQSPQLPDNASILAFTGRPDVDEAAQGRWPAPWFKKFYKHTKPAPWVLDHWRDE